MAVNEPVDQTNYHAYKSRANDIHWNADFSTRQGKTQKTKTGSRKSGVREIEGRIAEFLIIGRFEKPSVRKFGIPLLFF